MPRIVRGQLAQEIADRLSDVASRIRRLDQYSGEARESQMKMLTVSIASERQRLSTLVRSCRAAKNSYPNYPALRRAIGDAGDAVYELASRVDDAERALSWQDFMAIAQDLRLVSFVPHAERDIA